MAVLSDRRPAAGVERRMKAYRTAVALSLGLGTLLGACSGGLSNPDLTTGAVSGRVANAAAAGGYVYVLGAPSLLAPLGADGSFALGDVPVGAQALVLVAGYEGGGASVTKAGLTTVTVRPGMRESVSQDAAQMLAAGRVVAAVRPPTGALSQGATFSALGSNQIDRIGPAGGQVLGDLPAGVWQVTARLAGFRAAQPVAAAVPAGASVQVEIPLEVKTGDPQPGCLSTGCDNGLHCSPDDGLCYPCVDAKLHCNGDDLRCDPESHTCVEGVDEAGDLCEAADVPGKCPGSVWVQVQASPPRGYCSRACPGGLDAECPSGWRCGAGVCQVVQSCVATRSAFGAPCSRSSSCQEALAGGRCVREDDDHPGTCSAPCAAAQSCLDAGLGSEWTCRPLPGASPGSPGYCQR